MSGIIGKKLGMTSLYSAAGKNLPCTLVEVGPCVVTQVKTKETDGYNAVQVGYGSRKEKNTPAALLGHFKKAGVQPAAKLAEFRNYEGDVKVGDAITIDGFKEGEIVFISGKSKGKGFQGVVRRHNFAGVGGQTHGQHNRGRHPGSIGACSTPSRVFKGMKMAGQMGNATVTFENIEILKVLADKNILVVKGSIPGSKGSIVLIEK